MSNIVRGGSTYHNMKKVYSTWDRKRIRSATCTLVHKRRSASRPFMTLVIGGAQRDDRPRQCLPLPFSNNCAHTVGLFVSSMFTLSVMEADSTKRHQPLRTTVQISESMRFRTHVYWTFVVLIGTTISQNIRHFFNTLYLMSHEKKTGEFIKKW